MRVKTTSIALVAALAAGAGFAFFHDGYASASAPSDVTVHRAQSLPGPDDDESQPPLPADHPAMDAIEPGAGPTSGDGVAIEPSDLPATLAWKAPATWPTAPNPSSMRIATHKVPRASGDAEDADLSISRAGGELEANVQRWVGQFDGAGEGTRRERTVRGFKITIVEAEGTYQGGMGSASAPHAGWALLGAIVSTPGESYFFKLTGPAATVRAARSGFDALLDSVAPSGT